MNRRLLQLVDIKLSVTFHQCLTDNGWQDLFDMAAIGDKRYEAYVTGGLQDHSSVEFSALEDIATRYVYKVTRIFSREIV